MEGLMRLNINYKSIIFVFLPFLIFTQAQESADKNAALITAAIIGDVEEIKNLLQAGANVNAQLNGTNALMSAAFLGHAEAVTLLQAGADVNAHDADGSTALTTANNIEVVRSLLQAGADVNVRNANGWTVLMVAANGGRVDVVQALIQAGADVNAHQSNGRTALMLAVFKGYADVVQALIEAGANLEVREADGMTCSSGSHPC
jgi:uncharacterized protein